MINSTTEDKMMRLYELEQRPVENMSVEEIDFYMHQLAEKMQKIVENPVIKNTENENNRTRHN
jgi:thymidine kinase